MPSKPVIIDEEFNEAEDEEDSTSSTGSDLCLLLQSQLDICGTQMVVADASDLIVI